MNEAQASSRPGLISAFYVSSSITELSAAGAFAAQLFLHRAVFFNLIKYELVLVIGNLTVFQCLGNVAVL